MYDDIDRQFLQRLQVVPEGLFDEVALLHAGGADVPFEQIARRAGHDCRDLSFSFHDEQEIFYSFVEGRINPAAGGRNARSCRE